MSAKETFLDLVRVRFSSADIFMNFSTNKKKLKIHEFLDVDASRPLDHK